MVATDLSALCVALQRDLAAERIENTKLREAVQVFEKGYNEAQADLAAARTMRDTWQTRYTVNAEHLKHVQADLAAITAAVTAYVAPEAKASWSVRDIALLATAHAEDSQDVDKMEADLAAARAVLDAAQAHDSDITFAAPKVWIQVDRAAWQAWVARGRQT